MGNFHVKVRAFFALGFFLAGAGSVATASSTDPIYEPQVERRDVVLPAIDEEHWGIAAFVGGYKPDNFDTQPVYGGRLSYFYDEQLFLTASMGKTEIDDSNRESLGFLSVINDPDLEFAHIDLGYNVFKGEVFAGTRHAANAQAFVTLGAGITSIDDDEAETVTLGAGARIIITDWLALQLEVRDHVYDTDRLSRDQVLERTEKTTHNLEAGFSLLVFF